MMKTSRFSRLQNDSTFVGRLKKTILQPRIDDIFPALFMGSPSPPRSDAAPFSAFLVGSGLADRPE
jgi:hypothetical protein